ncbi:MAG: RagB/SusD family nutrient uptake outer membrane protein [Bacteroidales bacterium]
MKKICSKVAVALGIAATLHGCALDEYNPSSVTADDALQTIEGFTNLVNYCYSPLNSALFSNADYLTAAEAGTDLWTTANKKSYSNQFFYYEDLNSSVGYVFKLWRAAYNIIHTCNAVVERAPKVKDMPQAELDAKVAEARCLRAFYYSILVEQFGDVTLYLEEAKEPNLKPVRSSVAEIYAAIVADLKFAADHLPVKNEVYGRVVKKTAKGLLSRVYLQGSAYMLTDDQTGKSYVEMAKITAEDLIDNMAAYDAHLYTDFADVFSNENNRNNTEALFVSTGAKYGTDAANHMYFCNHFRSFLPKLGYYTDLGLIEKGMVYGRANSWVFQPTKYLLDVFDEKDNRYYESFISAFSNYSCEGWDQTYQKQAKTINQSVCDKYGISEKFLNTKIYPRYEWDAANNGDMYVWNATGTSYTNEIDPLMIKCPVAENDSTISIFISKEYLSEEEKAKRPYFCLNIEDLYGEDGFVTDAVNVKTQICPTLRKYFWTGKEYVKDYQNKTGNVFIMRMAEIYLIAAEANIMLNNPAKAAEQINVLRERACDPADFVEGVMKVTANDMNIDFILDERARELCGEYSRWYDLKRTGKFEDRLAAYNPIAKGNFNPAKHYLRPISQDFLNQIENSSEYGNNPGY